MKLHSKQDFSDLMFKILDPLKPYYSKNCARLQLGKTMAHYDINATWMEAFSRPLWGLVPFWAGGGQNKEFEDICRKGLCSGTDKNNEEYWGDCNPFDQRFVEMAAIASGIMFAPHILWDPLSEEQKDNLVEYLNQINDKPLPLCNWIFFAILVNIALKQKGRRYNEEQLQTYIAGIDSFYLGDGWYQDGDSGQKDYYISFAIHYYSLIYAKVMEKEDPERAKLYKERAAIFAKQFIYWFDESGEALPFGRSLTYRFAQVSFFSACLMAGIEPFPIGVMKGLIVRHFESWMSKPIFDRDGVLTIGYGYPNLIMAERYNAPGSPYWAMKTFGFMMLPDEHPFWSVEAQPLPKLKKICPMPYADMLMYHYGTHTTAFTPGIYSPFGHGQIVAKYGKFAYDTKFSFCIARSNYELHENAPDSMLAFWIDGYVYVRRICLEHKILEDGVWSKWSPYPGITVETTIIPNDSGHTRTHVVTSKIQCEAYDCGFSVNRGDFENVDYACETLPEKSICRNNYSQCSVEGSIQYENGNSVNGVGHIINADPNQNLLYTKVAIPTVRFEIKKGTQIINTTVNAAIVKY